MNRARWDACYALATFTFIVGVIGFMLTTWYK